MSAKSFNEDWQKGQTAAGDRLPALQRKYESVLRANAKKTAARYATVTAAAKPDEEPSAIMDESGLKVAITARTAAERKRMAKLVVTPLLGATKPDFYDAIIATLGRSQAEEATKAVRDALNQTISDSLDQGWTVPETATKIEETLTDYATWEATRLARTDLVGISNSVSLKAAQSLGDEAPRFKRWLTAGDDLVRDSHQDAADQTVEVSKTFSIGGFPMDHPGDWVAPAQERMNCRCVSIYLDDADAKVSHSFQGGIVEDPIANASDDIQEALAAASEVPDTLDDVEPDPDSVVLEIVDQASEAIVDGDPEKALEILREAVGILDPEVVAAAAFSEKQRDKLADEGIALPDGSFPIRNKADLSNAISSLGRAKDVAKAKKHIVARAKALDAIASLPEAWGITAAGVELLTEESDPWYDEDATAPVSPLVAERESLYKGNGAKNRRMGTQVPSTYDSVQAAREMGLRASALDEEISAPEAADNARAADELCPGCGAKDGEAHADDCEEAITAAAAAAPIDPPDEWFDDPQFDGPTPITVTADGRVMGHLGEWGKCHTGIGGRCVMIPRSQNGYADFHNGGLVTASGKEIRVGKITLDTGHAPLQAGASRAAAHYDHTGHVGAFVRAGEDDYGPWLAGAVRSDATPEQIRDLRANPPSGDWRKLQGRHGLELIAALAVPVQGFPVAALAASGELTGFISGWGDTGDLALVASGDEEALTAANPNHDDHGRFDEGSAAAERARAAKAIRNTHELDDPPVMREEVGRKEATGTYGDHGFKPGDQVRTGEGHAGEVVGDSYGGSHVRVRRTMDGMVEDHEPHTLKRSGSTRAALPPRDRVNLVASSDPFDLLVARLDGMDGLTSLVAAPISEEDADREMALLAARLEGIDGLAALTEAPEPVIPTSVNIDNSGGGTVNVYLGGPPEALAEDIGDDELDAEIAYQVDFFNNYGYWPSGAQSGATFTDAQMARVKMLAPLLVSDPDAPTSVAIRDRLVRKGLLYSAGL